MQACRYSQQVTALQFSPCGAWLAAAGWGGAVSLFHRAVASTPKDKSDADGSSSTPVGITGIPAIISSPHHQHQQLILPAGACAATVDGSEALQSLLAGGPTAVHQTRRRRKSAAAWVVGRTAACAATGALTHQQPVARSYSWFLAPVTN